MLDQFYISVLNFYKSHLGRKSLSIALIYINLLELSIIILLSSFFLAFAKQMKLITLSATKFWIIFTLISVFIIFKNWMRFNGKRRTILKAKIKAKPMSIYLLWSLPLACLALTYILFQVQ